MSESTHLPTDRLSNRLRDQLLQDLVAVGVIVSTVRQALPDDPGLARAEEALATARNTIEGDLDLLRGVIGELRAAEPATTDVVKEDAVA
ncbi:MAG: histidine kinase [Dehalococcoidia bacterium]